MVARVVFFGSPEFAIPSLSKLLHSYNVVGVVSQPDRPSGRGKILTAPPVKEYALSQGLPVLQPEKLREPGVVEKLLEWDADVYVVAAFGQIFRKTILALPRYGLINVHASLLPRWRGASPVQAAILNGDEVTGVTIMRIDEGIDTGDMLNQKEVRILEGETAGELATRLADVGAELLLTTLPGYLNGEVSCIPQPNDGATYAGMIKKEDAWLDFQQSLEINLRKIRAYSPWPVARVDLSGTVIQIHRAHGVPGEKKQPGYPYICNGSPAISVEGGLLILDQMQLPGKKMMEGKAYLAGNPGWGKKIN
jgi:methionyl-tRNA formyltransferase